jgi:hypothetical protein
MHQESFEGLSMRNTLLKDSQETTRKDQSPCIQQKALREDLEF